MKLYTDLASWWPLVSPPSEYADEAEFVHQLLSDLGLPIHTMLELGCGGGHLASHLKAHYPMTLSDLSLGMLAVSRALNLDCEHHAGDMRTIRLGKTFDAVMIHDAIMYMRTEDDLRRALETAFVHTRPRGVAVFIPDCTRESYTPKTESGGEDGLTRGLRYLQWDHDPAPGETTFFTDFAYLLREGDHVWVEHDRHEFGLFPRATWMRLLREVGFQNPTLIPDPWEREIFVATTG
jgi:SAM-dependent methyltransferase